jgi:hypothetical protein
MSGPERDTTVTGRGSDLAFLPFIGLLILATLTTLAAFFLVGVVVGVIVLVAWVVVALAAGARFLRRNELN